MSDNETAKVTLAYPYTDAAGKSHDADTTVTLTAQEAHDLLHAGKARPADSKTNHSKGN